MLILANSPSDSVAGKTCYLSKTFDFHFAVFFLWSTRIHGKSQLIRTKLQHDFCFIQANVSRVQDKA